MKKKSVWHTIFEILNKVKVTVDSDLKNVGLVDLVKKKQWNVDVSSNEISGELELRVKMQKPDEPTNPSKEKSPQTDVE